MNISPINNSQYNTNFGALKSINFIGEFKKSPVAQEKILNAFEASSLIQKFCKKFDVDVVFRALKDETTAIQSTMAIFYKEIPDSSKSFLEKMKDLFKKNDPIVINGYDWCSYTPEEAADVLSKSMSKQWGIFDYKISEFEKLQAQRNEARIVQEAEKQKLVEQEESSKTKQEEVNERIKNLLGK